MKFELLDEVVLARDLPQGDLKAGAPGTVVEIHDDGALEVEFFDEEGSTIDVFTVQPSDLRPPEPAKR
jgi:hypothetical protein